MKYVSLFAGVGGFDLALNRLGHECVYANEWDKYSARTYEKNFGHRPDTRSITDVSASEIPDHDLLCGGFPCQSFSLAGKRQGFDDTRGTLFFDIARIIEAKLPRYVLLENVKGLLSHDSRRTFGVIIRTLSKLGYDIQWQVLNSKNFGVPQNRERVFIIGHLRGTPRPEVFPIARNGREDNAVYERESEVASAVVATYGRNQSDGQYVNQRVVKQPFVALTETRTEEAKRIRRETKNRDFSPRRGKVLVPRKDDKMNNITANQSKEHLMTDGYKIRRLTPIECERLQGFPDNWTEGVSDFQRYRQMGNAVTVNVVEAIAKRL